MNGLLGCGILGGCGPTCPDGAAAQQASADYWRRQQEGMFNAAYRQTPEEKAEWDRILATRKHVEALREELWEDTVDRFWLGLLWVAGCGLAACTIVCFRGHW